MKLVKVRVGCKACTTASLKCYFIPDQAGPLTKSNESMETTLPVANKVIGWWEVEASGWGWNPVFNDLQLSLAPARTSASVCILQSFYLYTL